LEALVCL